MSKKIKSLVNRVDGWLQKSTADPMIQAWVVDVMFLIMFGALAWWTWAR